MENFESGILATGVISPNTLPSYAAAKKLIPAANLYINIMFMYENPRMRETGRDASGR
jgi:hypothetical protein